MSSKSRIYIKETKSGGYKVRLGEKANTMASARKSNSMKEIVE